MTGGQAAIWVSYDTHRLSQSWDRTQACFKYCNKPNPFPFPSSTASFFETSSVCSESCHDDHHAAPTSTPPPTTDWHSTTASIPAHSRFVRLPRLVNSLCRLFPGVASLFHYRHHSPNGCLQQFRRLQQQHDTGFQRLGARAATTARGQLSSTGSGGKTDPRSASTTRAVDSTIPTAWTPAFGH